MPRKVTVLGPPGTGKTTYILGELEKDFKKYKPYEVAFVSFTNQGVDEGKGRAMQKFELKAKELPYFGTIHSLCFRAMKMSRTSIIMKQHYRLFSEKTGINFCGHYTEDYSSPNDAYLHAVEMKKQNPTTHKHMLSDLNMNEHKYDFIETEIGRMKEQLGLKDFTDILIDYDNAGEPLPVKIAYVDEAQDLTQLQWKIIEKMFSKAEKIVIAGDDDQAVYEWAGADVTKFITFSEEKVMLDQSYRMPKTIHAIARNIISDISFRQEKLLMPKDEDGELDIKEKLGDVELIGGELILARTKYILRELSKYLMLEGYSFRFKGKSSIDVNTLMAIFAYDEFREGKRDFLEPKHASLFDAIYKDVPWYDTLKESEGVINYYKKVISSKGYLRDTIEMETFHGSKGSENSHVILATDTSKRVEAMRAIYPDMELRCLFVGVTRSSSKLTILKPTRKNHCPMEYFNL